MSGALSLASAIAAMDRVTLVTLVSSRRVLSPASVNDPLGLALELLRPDSINRALQSAHRQSLEALHELAEGGSADNAVLQQLECGGLVGLDPSTGRAVALPEITEALASLDFDSMRGEDQRSQSQVDTTSWYGPALTSVRRSAQLLRMLAKRSARLGRKGRPTALALRDLADAVHSEPETVDRLVETMRDAGLLAAVPWHDGADHLVASRSAQEWLELGYPERWVALATAGITQIDGRLRLGLEAGGDDLASVMQHLPIDFPLLPQAERDVLGRATATVEDLGLTVSGRLTPVALALLQGDTATAELLAHQSIPAPVEGVYLQPDLSLIVPGPLLPSDEAALSAVAETEQLGPAASLRLSATSLARAVRSGMTPAEIRALLQRLSLTGIPQPLDYLLNDLERKIDEAPELSGAARIAQEPSHEDLATHLSASEPAPANRRSEIEAMTDRVYSASKDSDGDAGMLRQLELAIRDRTPVQVTAVSGSHERIFLLLPVSLRGGRLRATDQQAGVERTLPVSAIVAVESA